MPQQIGVLFPRDCTLDHGAHANLQEAVRKVASGILVRLEDSSPSAVLYPALAAMQHGGHLLEPNTHPAYHHVIRYFLGPAFAHRTLTDECYHG